MIAENPLVIEMLDIPAVYCIVVSKLCIYLVISGVWHYEEKKGVCSAFSSYLELTIFSIP
jgi:hypothetical protein